MFGLACGAGRFPLVGRVSVLKCLRLDLVTIFHFTFEFLYRDSQVA